MDDFPPKPSTCLTYNLSAGRYASEVGEGGRAIAALTGDTGMFTAATYPREVVSFDTAQQRKTAQSNAKETNSTQRQSEAK